MMKSKWLFIGIILVLVMILVINLFKKEKKFQHYLVLGDSIAEGYALNDKGNRYSKIVQDHYQIKNQNFTDLSKSGMTAQALAENIKNAEYRNAIKNSDLITISIGSNELLGVFTTILQEIALTNLNKNPTELLTALAIKLKSSAGKAQLENGILIYEQSWGQIVEDIKTMNPNATIIATEFYNPFYGITELGDIARTYIEQLNQILKEKSNNETMYYIAKIYQDFNNTGTALTNMNINFEKFNLTTLDPHPNVKGHKLIAEKILKVLANK